MTSSRAAGRGGARGEQRCLFDADRVVGTPVGMAMSGRRGARGGGGGGADSSLQDGTQVADRF